MKKFTKVCLIAGGVCILAGGGIASMAAALGARLSDAGVIDHSWPELDLFGDGGPLDYLDDYAYRNDYAYRTDGNRTGRTNVNSFRKEYAQKLDLEVKSGRVVILPDSDSEEITVISDSRMKGINVSCEGDELKIYADPQTADTDFYMTVYIHLPADQRFREAKLQIEKQGGVNKYDSFIAAEDFKADKLEIDTHGGSVTMKGGDVNALKVDSDVSALKYQGKVSGDVDVGCSVGAVKLDLAGVKTDYNYETKCKVGAITIGGESYSGLYEEKAKKTSNGASKQMKLNCKAGVIDLHFNNE